MGNDKLSLLHLDMGKSEKAEQAAKIAADREELVSLMEPLLIVESSRHRAGLTDLAFDWRRRAPGSGAAFPPACLPPSPISCGR